MLLSSKLLNRDINLSIDSVSEYEALVESLLVFENFIGMKEWWTSATDEVPPFSQLPDFSQSSVL